MVAKEIPMLAIDGLPPPTGGIVIRRFSHECLAKQNDCEHPSVFAAETDARNHHLWRKGLDLGESTPWVVVE